MTRIARQTPAGGIVHIISRFVNRDFRLVTRPQRRDYLSRVAPCILQSDWILLGYALMSSHVHWAAIAGHEPLWRFIKPLHCGFARWLNVAQGKIGPVFADRPRTVILAPEDCGLLLAYIHNNPVRARIALTPDDPRTIDWTSHRAYTGLEEGPGWLAAERGLELSGFDASEQGRAAFNQFAYARAGQERDPLLVGEGVGDARSAVRRRLGTPAEVATPTFHANDELECPLVVQPGTPIRPVWNGTSEAFLALVSRRSGVPVWKLSSRDRCRSVVRARRLVLLLGHRYLGWTLTQLSALIGVSRPAASKLLRSRSADLSGVDTLAHELSMELVANG